MNTKTIVVTLSIIGGLIGLAVVANCFVKEAPPPPSDEKKKAPVPDKAPKPEPSISAKEETKEFPNPVVELQADEGKELAENVAQTESTVALDNFIPKAQEEKKSNLKIAEPASKVLPMPLADEFPLRLGSKGPRVERLQVWLLRNYGHTGKVTGEFDESTAAELKRRLNKMELDESTFQRYRMGKHVHEQVIIR